MLNVPKYIEIELKYSFLEEPVLILFLRRRKKEADLEEKERMLGDGIKLDTATKLSQLVENIVGFPGLEPRGDGEDEQVYRTRVFAHFNNPDGLEFAEDFILAKQAAVSPRYSFRSSATNRVEVNARGKEAGGHTVLPLLSVPPAGEGPEK
jgi:hypothetical protein